MSCPVGAMRDYECARYESVRIGFRRPPLNPDHFTRSFSGVRSGLLAICVTTATVSGDPISIAARPTDTFDDLRHAG